MACITLIGWNDVEYLSQLIAIFITKQNCFFFKLACSCNIVRQELGKKDRNVM